MHQMILSFKKAFVTFIVFFLALIFLTYVMPGADTMDFRGIRPYIFLLGMGVLVLPLSALLVWVVKTGDEGGTQPFYQIILCLFLGATVGYIAGVCTNIIFADPSFRSLYNPAVVRQSRIIPLGSAWVSVLTLVMKLWRTRVIIY